MLNLPTFRVAIMLALGITASACNDDQKAPVPDIPFAPIVVESITDSDNPTTKFRVDMAKVEHDAPLSRADRMKITQENLAAMTQEQIDQVYGRLTAGPIPDGIYRGGLFFARGDEVRPLSGDPKVRIGEVIGGVKGRIAEEKIELVEKIGHRLWKGKVFYRDQRILRNMIEDLVIFDALEKIDDPDTVMTVKIPRDGWLGRILPSNEVSLLFPAKLYCGQSLLDSRRESVIVDYFYSEDIEGYRKSPDSLAARGGLKIRDEIRMVRPGLYLGRAYTNKVFLLNFTLYNQEVAERGAESFIASEAIAEDCWAGEQQNASVQ